MRFGKFGFNSPNDTEKRQRYKKLMDRQTSGRAEEHPSHESG